MKRLGHLALAVAIAFPSLAFAQYGSREEQFARANCWTQQFGSTAPGITRKSEFVAIDKCVTKALGYQDPYLADMKARHWSQWR